MESFFYVFILALTRKEGRLPANSRFTRWTAGDWEDATEARVEDMSRDNFPLLLDEWDKQFENCKTLAWTLWHLLFKNEDELFWGTDTSKEGMDAPYDGFLEAFDQAILGYESV
ncbi:serine/threonine-protein kinase Sgk2 [Akanthomyces lecanii RCEF 1005]|uniref:Serine/threonine-protein kinase Sgk2 n=1 Tax=Akanthomyces lecanii RCEF 1005 TaxID=1081108 RepID=A0A167YJT2_CORDF|nr:serine/threonine-protein kinase Sgk2 [Akanthomyces lecanii RCEF 1005]